ncbi:MAG: carbohydrate-binding domain-containing protein [Proteobacteria bacterium]|nr:carbohydrate-binding domain-containing protein [Pseudomonadota bacterium]
MLICASALIACTNDGDNPYEEFENNGDPNNTPNNWDTDNNNWNNNNGNSDNNWNNNNGTDPNSPINSDPTHNNNNGSDTGLPTDSINPGDCDPTGATTDIALSDGGIQISGTGATVMGNVLTIDTAGTYRLSGNMNNGQVLVRAGTADTVKLILDGINLSNGAGAALVAVSSGRLILVTTPGSQNSIADASARTDGIDANGAITSQSDVLLCGGGALAVNGRFNDAISTKDSIVFNGGTWHFNAVDDAIRGKDYIHIKDGNIVVTADGDGIKSDNASNAAYGVVQIDGGDIQITTTKDGIAAKNQVIINEGTISVIAGGGSAQRKNDDISQKGIKSTQSMVINGGDITVDASDDAIHANQKIAIHGGTLHLLSGDDGIHADYEFEMTDGDVTVENSVEGIEAEKMYFKGGTVHVVASDDGLNASPAVKGNTNGPWGGMGTCQECLLSISGGWIVVDALGDGLDSNGHFEMTDGTVLVHGPRMNVGKGNSAIDCNGNFNMHGGTLVSVDVAQMPDEIDGQSTQKILNTTLSTNYQAGTLIYVASSSGTPLLTFRTAQPWKKLTFSSPQLQSGTYNVYVGGSASGEERDGLFTTPVNTQGTLARSVTVN